ncbi:MAG: serine hydroxymethyltransferase, partial [Parasporobacterium sp.]|nr:serine hydroxymethyltransferase [Parasporobacterium sp.]
MHVIAAKAVCYGEALQPEFKTYAQNVIANAQALSKGLMDRGIKIFTGGTDNHLMLVDLRPLGISGKEAEDELDEAGITCNKNAIPNDTSAKVVTGGIRLGTAALTTRGLMVEDMDTLAEAIKLVVVDRTAASKAEAKAMIEKLTDKYPLYGSLV